MKKSELAAKIANLEYDLLKLWALHNQGQKLLREWVEKTEDLRKHVAWLEVKHPQEHGSYVPYTQTGPSCGTIDNTARGGIVPRNTFDDRGRLSTQTAEVQQQIRDMLVDE